MRQLLLIVLLVPAACARPAPAGPASVLLVTIDTLRADRVGAYGDAAARTPRLDALAREGVVFERAFSPVPLTLPAHATILTGLLPPEHGVRGNGAFALPAAPATLAEAFQARGLETAAFVAAFPVARRFGLDRGFDAYDDAIQRATGLHFEFAERRADRVVDAALAWLAGRSGAVFVWVHLYDPHAPYDPPAGFRDLDPYRGEIAFADAQLGRLLTAWDARAAAGVTAVASDHGEAFGEHAEESHGLFVYDTTLRVPLLLRGPGIPAGVRVGSPVGLADLAATLSELVGKGPFPHGRSLARFWGRGRQAAAAEEAALYAETLAPRFDFGWSELRAWREGRYKYVRAPRAELYDVEADPGESRDLKALQPAVAERLAGRLEAALGRMGDALSHRAPDTEAAERLRALGYVQGPGGRGSAADPKDKVELARLIARATGPFRGPAEVAAVYADLASRDPENPLVNFRLADALLRAGRTREAASVFRRVVEAGPRSADPFVGLATACAQLGRLGEAQSVLEQALEVEPGNGQVHYNLGELARLRGDTAEARARYEGALADPVTRERAQARLGALARAGGR
jgi:Flp pilus assembly protein TadD